MGRPPTTKVTVGQRFGRLEVIERLTVDNKTCWKVKCECATEKVLTTNNLHGGYVRSCGCLRHERINLDHGHASHRSIGRGQTRTYKTWANIDKAELVEERWLDFNGFLLDMGLRPDGHMLGRLDFDEGFGPDNCFWEDSHDNAVRRGYRTAELKGLR